MESVTIRAAATKMMKVVKAVLVTVMTKMAFYQVIQYS